MQWFRRVGLTALVSGLSLLSLHASRADIVGLYNTGVDDNRVTLGTGVFDPHWTTVNSPTYPNTTIPVATYTPPSNYVADDPAGTAGGSRWISQNPPGSSVPNSPPPYTYQTSFSVNSTGSQTITGKIAADDVIGGPGLLQLSLAVGRLTSAGFVPVHLDFSQLTPDPGYSQFYSFSYTFTAIAGDNFALQVYDNNTNQGNPQFSPEAIRIAFTPEPATVTMGLGAMGLLGVVGVVRRRRAARQGA